MISQDGCDSRRRSPRLRITKERPACVSQDAVNSFLFNAMLDQAQAFQLNGIPKTPLFSMPTNTEECANGVVHRITKETLTKYQKVIEVPELREIWMRAMCIELGRLTQGFGTTAGTNTCVIMDHNEIKKLFPRTKQ